MSSNPSVLPPETVPAVPPPSGPDALASREEFGATELTLKGETAAAAVAAQLTAVTQARYIMALRRPRDMDNVRTALLKECRRPGFAKVARYAKPVGGSKVEGPSIRFAEAAIRLMGNLEPFFMTIYDDSSKRIVRVTITDLETNVSYAQDVTIDKTVERKQLKQGDVPLRIRQNSQGQQVYLLPATEEDLLNKENARISKALRTHGLRLLPGDILEDCMDEVKATVRNAAAKDPEGQKKKILDAFSSLGIQPSDVKEYLGHELAFVSEDEHADLLALYQAIKDGEATFRDAIAQKKGKNGEASQEEATTKGTVGERVKAKAEESAKKKPAAGDLELK